jgi:hypothetical protein
VASGKLNLGAFVPALATVEEDLRPVFVLRANGAALQCQASLHPPDERTSEWTWWAIYLFVHTAMTLFEVFTLEMFYFVVFT